MNGRRTGNLLLFYIAVMAATALLLGRHAPIDARQVERQNNDLRITAVDTSAFPTVAVRILTTTNGSAPIADLTRLILRENGVPIVETATAQTPVGVDLALVLDANPDFLQIDGRDGVSRRDKVATSIARFAQQYMSPAGLDRVSIIVPDETGEGAAFLVTDTSRPGELSGAVDAYQPTPPRLTPLQSMLSTAIDHLAAGEEGRFRAILIYTDAARLNQQLDYQALAEAAQAADIPIFAAILGVEASPDEIANVAALYTPTNGAHVHMPEPEAADPLYDIFRRQGSQPEITYQSESRQNGPHELSVSLGNVRDTAVFELSLAAPEVTLVAAQTEIRRAGSAIDTPLPLLQPAILPLTAQITWPDGRPRALSEVTFRVDGVSQPLAADLTPDGAGQIPLVWDISERDTGSYRLEVEVTDALGFQAAAEPLAITIEVARPTPPTPTPAPTRAPRPSLAERAENPLFPLLALAAVAVVAAAIFWASRRRRARATAEDEAAVPQIVPAAGPPPDDRHVAVLVWPDETAGVDQIELLGVDVTFGREPDDVDIVVDDPTVSRLHARIRRNAAGEYWLYDEGSIEGTFLNYERLGLAPRRLQHNDVVQMGRVTLRFRLELPGPYTGGATSPENFDGG